METARIMLRPSTHADAELLYELDGDPEVMRHLSGGARTPREYALERDAWHATSAPAR